MRSAQPTTRPRTRFGARPITIDGIDRRVTLLGEIAQSNTTPRVAISRRSGISAWPHDCGQAMASYGPLQIGSRIVLGTHTPWTGADGQGGYVSQDTNWGDEMSAYVGQTAMITSLEGLDTAGCAIVHVDVDGGQWVWRVRDAQPAP